MGANFFIIFLITSIAVLLGVSGFIMLFYGLINKQKKITITGSIFSSLAILIFVFGLLVCVRKMVRVTIDVRKDMRMQMMNRLIQDPLCMPMDARFMCDDSLNNPNDSGNVNITKKIIIRNHMKSCNPNMKCDPSKCKQKCSHHNK